MGGVHIAGFSFRRFSGLRLSAYSVLIPGWGYTSWFVCEERVEEIKVPFYYFIVLAISFSLVNALLSLPPSTNLPQRFCSSIYNYLLSIQLPLASHLKLEPLSEEYLNFGFNLVLFIYLWAAI